MVNKVLDLDLLKDPTLPTIVYGRIADNRMQTIIVNVTRGGEIADLSNCEITFEGITYNERTKVFDSDNVFSTPEGLAKGTFEYTFPSEAFSVEGKYKKAYFSVVKGDKRDTTGNFEIIVLGNADIEAPDAETIITEYNKLVAELRALQEQAIEDMNQDFDEITSKITSLQNQIAEFNAEVNAVATEAVNTVNAALEEFKAGDFYNKVESDTLFAKKTDLTKENVGLGNVDNFATATQAEAEAGTAANKFMTPSRVFQAIAKWVQGKFVSTTEPQTVLGTKNFQDGIQVSGKKPVLTNATTDYAMVDKNNNASVMSDGSLKLYRRGDLVYLTGSFKLSAGKYNQGVWFNIPSWAYPIESVRMYGKTTSDAMCLLFINQTDNNNITCVDNVAKDSWITISASWMAKNPY